MDVHSTKAIHHGCKDSRGGLSGLKTSSVNVHQFVLSKITNWCENERRLSKHFGHPCVEARVRGSVLEKKSLRTCVWIGFHAFAFVTSCVRELLPVLVLAPVDFGVVFLTDTRANVLLHNRRSLGCVFLS